MVLYGCIQYYKRKLKPFDRSPLIRVNSKLQTERWPSGLRRPLGKRVYGEPYRGFESPSLRHPLSLRCSVIAERSDASCIYTYILESLSNPKYSYIGATSNLKRRLAEHNSGKSIHANKFTP